MGVENLMSVVNGLSSWDLDKALDVDMRTGDFKVNREVKPGSKSIDEHQFLTVEQDLTEAGYQNMAVRLKVASALSSLLEDPESATGAQRAFLEKICRDLLGRTSLRGDISLAVVSKPLALREVKALLTTAENLFALARLQGAEAGLAQRTADLTLRLQDRGALNGQQKAVDKMLSGLEKTVAKLGERYLAAETDAARADIERELARTLTTFNNAAEKFLSKQTSVEDIAKDVLTRYMKKNGPLGDATQLRFILSFAHAQRTPGLNVRQLRAKLTAELPAFLTSEQPTPPLKGRAFGELGIRLANLNASEATMRQQEQTDRQKLQEGQLLTVTRQIEITGDKFNTDIFLAGGPDPSKDCRDQLYDFRQGSVERPFVKGMTFRSGNTERRLSFDAPDPAQRQQRLVDNAYQTTTTVQRLCRGNPMQISGVIAALGQRVDLVARLVADASQIPGFVEGSTYAVSCEPDGSILVKISTVPESSLESSVTIRVARDGTRTVAAFSGVKTNTALADRTEQAARHVKFAAETLPRIEQTGTAKFQQIETLLARNAVLIAIGPEAARELLESARQERDLLLQSYRELNAPNVRLGKDDYRAYENEFNEALDALVTRVTTRATQNVELMRSFISETNRLRDTGLEAEQRLRAQGQGGVADQVHDLRQKLTTSLDHLRADFYVSGETSNASIDGLKQTLKTYVDRMITLLEELPTEFKRPEDFQKLAELQSAELPRFAFTSFSVAAKARVQSAGQLVSCEPVAQLGVKDPAFAPVAEAVNTCVSEVNDLLQQTADWPEEDRQALTQFASEKMSELSQALVDAHEAGVDFQLQGISKLLKDTFDPIAARFADHERTVRQQEVTAALDAAKTKIQILLNDPAAKLSQPARTSLEVALGQIAALQSQRQEASLPTRFAVKAFVLELDAEVDRFLSDVKNRPMNLKNFFDFCKASLVKPDPTHPLYPFNPPSVTLTADTALDDARRLFADEGVESLDALNRLSGATRAVKSAIRQSGDLLKSAEDTFMTLEGAEEFLEIDEESGNVGGFKTVNGQQPGRALVKAAFEDVVQARIRARLDAPHAPDAPLVDVGIEVDEAWKTQFLAEVKESLVQAISARANQRVEEVRQEQVGPLPGEVLIRGPHIFGLDIDRLTANQLTNLKRILFPMLLHSQQTLIEQEQDPDRLNAIYGQILHERAPHKLNAADPTQPSNSTEGALAIVQDAIQCVSEALLKGQLSLDEPLTDLQCKLCVNLMDKYMLSLQPGNMSKQHATGLNTYNPATMLEILTLNHLNAANLARMQPHFETSTLASMIEYLYLVNGENPNGLDALALRLFGCPITEMTGERFLAFKNAHTVHQDGDIQQEANELRDLDPLVHLDAQERQAAEFVLRSAPPTTAYVQDTLNVRTLIRNLQEQVRSGGIDEATGNVTYAGCALSVTVTASGQVTVRVPGAENEDGERAQVPFICPLDADAFVRQIEEEITRNVSAYGARTVLALMPHDGTYGVAERQLALNAIASATGTLATELCNLQSSHVIRIARNLLEKMMAGATDAKALLAQELAQLPPDEAVTFNGAATLESYQRMQALNGEGIYTQVELPNEVRRREGESLAEARQRQVHTFVAELVMPNDTTRYDLDRRAGKTTTDILRQTLLEHKYELGVVLNALGTSEDVLNSFTFLSGGRGQTSEMGEMTRVLKARMSELKAIVAREGGLDAFLQKVGDATEIAGLDALLTNFSGDVAQVNDGLLAKLQRMLTTELSTAFRTSKAARQPSIARQTLDEIASSGTLDVDSGYGQFLMESIATYFTKMQPIDRSRMMSSLVRYASSTSSEGELLGALIKGAGPVFQKFMQGLPQTALPPALRTAVADLKTNLPPIAPEMVRATLLDMVAASNGTIRKISLVASFGAATVGQTFLCRVYTTENPEGEDCIVKLLRPDVQNRARRERALFLELAAKNPVMKGALRTRIDSIFEELDFTVEANNVKQGAVYNSGRLNDGITGVRSMELYPHIAASANVMVLRRAPGETYDKYVQKATRRLDSLLEPLHPERREDGTLSLRTGNIGTYFRVKEDLRASYNQTLARQRNLSGFIEKWTYEVFFGDGFFHGDLHAGNIMCDDKQLTVIDYGNAGRLTETERKNLKWALAWVPAREPGRFLDYYRNLLSSEGQTQLDQKRALLEKQLQTIFERGSMSDTGKILAAIFQVIQDNQVELPGALFCILQSMQRLDESMRLLNEQLGRVQEAYQALELTADDGTAPECLRKIQALMAEKPLPVEDPDIKALLGGDPNGGEMTTTINNLLAHLPGHGKRRIFNAFRDQDVFGTLNLAIQHAIKGKQDDPPENGELQRMQGLLGGVFDTARLPQGLDSQETARTQLTNELLALQSYARSCLQSPDLTAQAPANDILSGVASLLADLERLQDAQPPTEEALARRLNEMYDKIYQLCSSTIRVQLRTDVYAQYGIVEGGVASEAFASFDDPSQPFGRAVERGSVAFLKELIPQDQGFLKMIGGAASVAWKGGLTLRDKLKERTREEIMQGNRESSIRQSAPWNTFVADQGLFEKETETIEQEIGRFRFDVDLLRGIRESGWQNRPAVARAMGETIVFNLECLKTALEKKGFGARWNDPAKRTAEIDYAMSCLAIARADWFRAFAKVTPAQIDAIAGGNADLKEALTCLHGIAHRNPPVDDTLSQEQTDELNNRFSAT